MIPNSSDHTDFGDVAVSGAMVNRVFTITNSGMGDLWLTNTPRVEVSGPHSDDFSVTIEPESPVVTGGSTAFVVRFDPTAAGLRSATLVIANDDGDESVYSFAIQGTGVSTSVPTVVGVAVKGTGWTEEFLDQIEMAGLGVDGYSIPVGSGEQLSAIPWQGINQIAIMFNEDVLITQGDLSVNGVATAMYLFVPVASGGFSYDPIIHTATWTLAAPISGDKLLLVLNSATSGVRNESGVQLDGEWDNPSDQTDSSSDTFPSGDGLSGGDFVFRFNVLAGDANGNGDVAFQDFFELQVAFGTSGPEPSKADLDTDGEVDFQDFLILQAQFREQLPSGEPEDVAGLDRDRDGDIDFQDFLALQISFGDVDELLNDAMPRIASIRAHDHRADNGEGWVPRRSRIESKIASPAFTKVVGLKPTEVVFEDVDTDWRLHNLIDEVTDAVIGRKRSLGGLGYFGTAVPV